jgi:hypothetical protein
MTWAVSLRCWIGKMFRYLLFTFSGFALFAVAAKGQALTPQSLNKNSPSPFSPAFKEKYYHTDSLHKPHTAVIRSLILPGLGQLYNRRWWKLPIIYTGFGLLAAAAINNQKNYAQLIAVYRLKHYTYAAPLTSTQNPNHALYVKYKTEYGYYQYFNDTQVGNLAESFRRNRDISILGIAGIWVLNTIDAYIDAKFINAFSVDNNLAVKPVTDVLGRGVYATNQQNVFSPGIKITFAIRSGR